MHGLGLTEVFEQEVLAISLADNCKAPGLLPDGSYRRVQEGRARSPFGPLVVLFKTTRIRHETGTHPATKIRSRSYLASVFGISLMISAGGMAQGARWKQGSST
jgi:hypothetical protein